MNSGYHQCKPCQQTCYVLTAGADPTAARPPKSSKPMMHEDLRPFLGYCKFSDTRGKFEGIVNRGCWEEVNLVHTQANCVRGGHFHRTTTEVIFLLTGKADVILTPCDNPEQQIKLSLTAGQGLRIEPMIRHDFIYQQDSTHIQLLDQRFDPENQDLHTSL